jgi:hypothetical protein
MGLISALIHPGVMSRAEIMTAQQSDIPVKLLMGGRVQCAEVPRWREQHDDVPVQCQRDRGVTSIWPYKDAQAHADWLMGS